MRFDEAVRTVEDPCRNRLELFSNRRGGGAIPRCADRQWPPTEHQFTEFGSRRGEHARKPAQTAPMHQATSGSPASTTAHRPSGEQGEGTEQRATVSDPS